MKKSLFGLMAATMVAACLAVASYAREAVNYAYSAAQRIGSAFMDGFSKLTAEPMLVLPKVAFVQAKAFVQRIAKRERPIMTSTWRMCPST